MDGETVPDFQVVNIDDDDYILVDDEGRSVEPAAEASLLMAVDVARVLHEQGGRGVSVEENEVSTGEQECVGIAITTDTDPLYLEAMEQAQMFFANSGGIEKSFDFIDTASDEPHEEENSGDANGQSGNDSDLEAEEEDGMECYGSRLHSDIGQDGDWMLDVILQRRRSRQPQTAPLLEEREGIDGDMHQLVGSSSISVGRPLEYLCRWVGYREATWEPRVWLEDLGYKLQADAFDKQQQSAVKRGPKKESIPRLPAKPVKLAFNFHRYWPDLITDIQQLLAESRYSLQRYAHCLPLAAGRAFIKQWSTAPKCRCPIRVFHGTRGICVKGILKKGLCVPGTEGVRVLNGQAYGRGIYTASNIDLSLSYASPCAGHQYLFVCAGLFGPGTPSFTAAGSQMYIFPSAACVVPFLLLEVQSCGHAQNVQNVEPKCVGVETILSSIDPSAQGSADGPIPVIRPGVSAKAALASASTPDGTSTATASGNTSVAGEDEAQKEPTARQRQNEARQILSRLPGHHVAAHAMTKKMIKKAPRYVKDFYARGLLVEKKIKGLNEKQ